MLPTALNRTTQYRLLVCILLLAGLLVAGTGVVPASAQPSASPGDTVHSTQSPLPLDLVENRSSDVRSGRTDPLARNRKDRQTARRWAGFATAVPLALGYIGQRWAERSRNSSETAYRRARRIEDVAFGVAAGGLLLGPSAGSFYAHDVKRGLRGILIRGGIAGATVHLYGRVSNLGGPNDLRPVLVLLVGTLLVGGSAAYDIVYSSAHSVEEYNEEIQARSGSVAVEPWYASTVQKPGLRIRVSF